MPRLTRTHFSVLTSVTLAVVWATACSSDDSKSSSSADSNASTGPSTGTMAGPTMGTMGSTTTGTPSTTGPATTGSSSSGFGTTGSGTTGNATTGSTTSTGGASSTTDGPTTTGSSSGTGGTGGGGPGTRADCSAAEGEVPALTLTPFVSGINVPVDITYPPGDDRMFVITLEGDVHVIKEGQLVETPFLSLGSKVVVGGPPGDERGLLGIAFHPNYAENGLLYVHYNAGQGVAGAGTSDSVIEEYKASSDPDVADPASARVVLIVDQPSGQNNHKGGSIEFGPDGLLYIGLGDGGGSGDMMGNAQNTSSLLGKILRIDPVDAGGMPYTTPADNLVMDVSGAAPEIWDYGLRNPFRFSFDVCDGDLYIGDVGQNSYEEITIEKAGEGRKNYGWNIWEALHCYPSGDSCSQDGITQPFVEVPRMNGGGGESITGGSVYRGSSIPALRGAYFYADFQTNNAWYLFYDRDAHSVSTPVSVTQDLNVNNIVAIKNGPDGELYFVSVVAGGEIFQGLGEGAIYKLTAAE